ncbi:hypothetical protein QTP88_022997 [Uroleucon formosanum]
MRLSTDEPTTRVYLLSHQALKKRTCIFVLLCSISFIGSARYRLKLSADVYRTIDALISVCKAPQTFPFLTKSFQNTVESATGYHYRWTTEMVAAYLPGVEVNRDHRGGSSRARSIHCTWNRLTPASIPNVDTSGAEFLLAGTAFAPSLIYH